MWKTFKPRSCSLYDSIDLKEIVEQQVSEYKVA